MKRPRLSIRARLTLIYTALFAVGGAIIIALSYSLVAQLGPSAGGGQGADGIPASTLKACKAEQDRPDPDKRILQKCNEAFRRQGATDQQTLVLSRLVDYSMLTFGLTTGLAAVLGWILAGRALRPIHQITAAARAASDQNLSARVGLAGPRDELRELAETFDQMLERLQIAFEGQRRFIADASHELRTPLAAMRASVDVVLANPASTADDLREMATDIRTEVDRTEHLISALLLLARNNSGLVVRDEVDLATTAEDVLDGAEPGDRRVHADLDPAVIRGDPVLAEHLVSNLVDNAIRYNASGGDVWIRTRTVETRAELIVSNTGVVISAEDAGRVFEPFLRLGGRTAHEGSGLGLAIVASIATVHGGSVVAEPREGGGLKVMVDLPAEAATSVAVGD